VIKSDGMRKSQDEFTIAGEHVSVQAGVGVGSVVGLLSGLMGIGGGVIAVPLLSGLVRLSQRRAHGTSLVVVAPTALVSVLSYSLRGQVDWALVLVLAVGTTLGVVLGARLTSWIPIRLLRLLFAILLLVTGIRMLVA
jgi:uncharacterized membrane protein YfcA